MKKKKKEVKRQRDEKSENMYYLDLKRNLTTRTGNNKKIKSHKQLYKQITRH